MKLTILAILLLAGCATVESDQALELRVRTLYTNECNAAGYQEYTPAHDRCLVSAALRARDAQQAAAAAAYRAPAPNPYYQDPNMFKPQGVTCQTVPYGNTLRTVCN